MKQAKYILFGLTALLSAQSVLAGDVAAGKAKAAVCAACHGTKGISTAPMYPNIAGQKETYLVAQLKAFRDKSRSDGLASLMQMQAASLSDDDIDNLAAYFSSLK